MNQRLFVFVLTLILLAACTSAPVTTPASVATLRPTALPDEAEVPQGPVAGTVMPAPTGVINPATIESLPSPTPLRGPTTITVNDLQMGQTLYLAVGDTFTFDSSVTAPILIGDERVVAHVTDAEGV